MFHKKQADGKAKEYEVIEIYILQYIQTDKEIKRTFRKSGYFIFFPLPSSPQKPKSVSHILPLQFFVCHFQFNI